MSNEVDDFLNKKTIQLELEQRAPYFHHLIANWISKDRNIKVLDLGCGYGAFLYFLKKEGYTNLEGVDNSFKQVELAKDLGLSFIQNADVLQVLKKYPDSFYDLIIAFDILEHFNKQDVRFVMSEIYRILKNGGRLILHIPNGEAIFSGSVYWSDLTHETCFTRNSIKSLINAVGFKKLNFVEDTPIVHGIKSFIRYILWSIFRTIFRLIHMAETGDVGKDLILTQNMLIIIDKN